MTAVAPAETAKRAKKPALQSVGIALGVLEALAVAPELSLSELARRVGVAKSTAHRTCSVLTDSGWNWTPHIGRRRCSIPITTPSSAQAQTLPSGPIPVIASEW